MYLLLWMPKMAYSIPFIVSCLSSTYSAATLKPFLPLLLCCLSPFACLSSSSSASPASGFQSTCLAMRHRGRQANWLHVRVQSPIRAWTNRRMQEWRVHANATRSFSEFLSSPTAGSKPASTRYVCEEKPGSAMRWAVTQPL